MRKQRAMEILNSKGSVKVYYNGLPVWLEDMSGDDVEVSFIGMDQRSSVPVSALIESD